MWRMAAILIIGTLWAGAQSPEPKCDTALPPPVVPGPQMSRYAADRENALAPANVAAQCHDYERAYGLYRKVLESYPKDARVLVITARAAVLAGHREEAIPLLQQALAEGGKYSLGIRLSMMDNFIQLNRWQDFEAERLDTRKASLAGDKTLPADTGYPIDLLQTPQEFIRVIEFPTLHGPTHARDRFLLYNEPDPCTHFTPYIDLEAASDEHSYSLVAYASAGAGTVLKTYPDGEPSYQMVRDDVLTRMDKPLTTLHGAEEPCTQASPPAPVNP